MQEITAQLGPLTERVGELGSHLERLYNSNGGPPGFLQTARAEDNRRFSSIFKILDEYKADVQPMKDFIKAHEIREEQRDQDRAEQAAELAETVRRADRKFKRFIALWSLALAAFMALIALYDHKDAILRTLVTPPAQHSQLLDSAIPPNP